MARKNQSIVKRSAVELRAMTAAGETHSDWNAAAEKAIPDGSDPDDAIEPVERATTELPHPTRKQNG